MSNDIIIQVWNTVLFDKYLRFKHLFTEGLAKAVGASGEAIGVENAWLHDAETGRRR
jgi:hypothetical protein